MITMKQRAAALEAIAKANGGVLTPDAVVQAASNPKHVLHGDFDWDDAVAAHKQRLNTARQLITSIRVVIEIEEVPISAISYVRDCRQGRKSQGYINVDALAKRKEDARATVMLELERIIGVIERSRSIAASLGLSAQFEIMLKEALSAKMRIQRGK